jgi:hypothetical protein
MMDKLLESFGDKVIAPPEGLSMDGCCKLAHDRVHLKLLVGRRSRSHCFGELASKFFMSCAVEYARICINLIWKFARILGQIRPRWTGHCTCRICKLKIVYGKVPSNDTKAQYQCSDMADYQLTNANKEG